MTPHQDGTFLYNEPLRLFGFWFEGEDKTYPDDAWVAAPVKSGSLVLIHGQVMPYIRNMFPIHSSSKLTCRFTTILSET